MTIIYPSAVLARTIDELHQLGSSAQRDIAEKLNTVYKGLVEAEVIEETAVTARCTQIRTLFSDLLSTSPPPNTLEKLKTALNDFLHALGQVPLPDNLSPSKVQPHQNVLQTQSPVDRLKQAVLENKICPRLDKFTELNELRQELRDLLDNKNHEAVNHYDQLLSSLSTIKEKIGDILDENPNKELSKILSDINSIITKELKIAFLAQGKDDKPSPSSHLKM